MSLLLSALEHGIIKIKGTGPVWEQGSVHNHGGNGLGNPGTLGSELSGKGAAGAPKKPTAWRPRSILLNILEMTLVQDLPISAKRVERVVRWGLSVSAAITQRLMTARVLIHVCDCLLNMHVGANYVLALGYRLGRSCIHPFIHQPGNNQCLLNSPYLPGRSSSERGICNPVHIKYT